MIYKRRKRWYEKYLMPWHQEKDQDHHKELYLLKENNQEAQPGHTVAIIVEMKDTSSEIVHIRE